MATSCKHLVNFGPITPAFKRFKSVHPLVDQQFGYVRLAAPLLDFAGISTEFSGAITTQLFHLYANGRHCYAARATFWALPVCYLLQRVQSLRGETAPKRLTRDSKSLTVDLGPNKPSRSSR